MANGDKQPYRAPRRPDGTIDAEAVHRQAERRASEQSRRARGEREKVGGSGISPEVSRRSGEAVADAVTPDPVER